MTGCYERSRLAAAFLLSAALSPAQQYVDDAVERARREFEVPGIAVAIASSSTSGIPSINDGSTNMSCEA